MTTCALVTGCAGFIGSHVADALLAGGHDVIGLDDLSGGRRENVPERVHFVRGSVGDVAVVRSVFRARRIDYVFHLAAYAAQGFSHFVRRFNYDNNVTGGVTLVNEAVNAGTVRCFVFTSSIAVYGRAAPPVSEETALAPVDPYGIGKLAVELDLMAALEMFGLHYIVFRPHNVFGERQNIADPSRNVIGVFMNQLLQGEPMTIFGDGAQSRAFTYISDVAPMIAESVRRPQCYDQAFNVGVDEVRSVLHVAHRVAAALGVTAAVEHLAPRRDVVHAFARHDRVRRYLGDLQQGVSLDAGLSRMATWARTQPLQPSELPRSVEIDRSVPPYWRSRSHGLRGR